MSTFLSSRPAAVGISPEKLAPIYAGLVREWAQLLSQAQTGRLKPPPDKRFNTPAWAACPQALLNAHAYLLSARALMEMADAADLTLAQRKCLRFSITQWVEAISPTNFLASNPEAQQTLVESQGLSLFQGLQSLLRDIHKGRLTQTDESHFRVGENVATTQGAVVFQNPLMQVIQYSPLCPQVHQTPLLIVPPCINKFYILDLQPGNSFVRYALQQGFTVFLISWRNPLPGDDDGILTATWGDYLEGGVLQAIQVAQDISEQEQIHALGFCVGGTMLASALALAKAQGEDPVKTLTLLTTLLDFEETGVLGVFVNEDHAQSRDRDLGQGGLMMARELATTFSFLRPAEMVWSYVVNNYLKGVAPVAFDLLSWNADSTNLPGPFFAWYFRKAYLENKLVDPEGVVVNGYPLDLSSLSMPAYVFGSHEDHIVPWQAAYASTRVLGGQLRFVLGGSGHIAGVINPPEKQRRNYWLNESGDAAPNFPRDPEAWLKGAESHAGSWWPDWSHWLASYSDAKVDSWPQLGNQDYPPLEAAPGHYVRVRAV